MYEKASSWDHEAGTLSTKRAISVDYPRFVPRQPRAFRYPHRREPSTPASPTHPRDAALLGRHPSGELRLQRCRACSRTYFPPQPFCPACASADIEIVRASGRGSLYSYVITHRAAPGFEAPYVIAEVELEEGPGLLSNLVDVAPDPDSSRSISRWK